MRSQFAIRDRNSDTWCYSGKHADFGKDFEFASLYENRKNAEKVIKDMLRSLDPKHNYNCPTWRLNEEYVVGTVEGQKKYEEWLITYPDRVSEVPPLAIPDFEVVEFELVQK